MSSPPDISVVVPFFNEEDSIPELHDRLSKVAEGIDRTFELVFIDDGSSDDTWRVLCEIQASDPCVRAVQLRRNFGQTPALAAGFDHARGDVIISMDGDLQHEPEQIPQFLEGIDEGYDLVSGWREKRQDSFVLRRLPSLAANRLMAWLSGLDLHDFGTTFKAYRREVLENIEMFGELHRFVPALASAVGVRVKEVPISNPSRKAGISKYGIGRTFGVFCDLITVKFLITYISRPIRVFGGLGVGSFFAGLLISAALLAHWIVVRYIQHVADYNVAKEHGGLLLLSVMLMLAGVQFFTMGLSAEIGARVYHRASGRRIYTVREVRDGEGASPT